MKLYLSSYRVPNAEEFLRLFVKPPAGCRLAIIPNAQDYKLPEERATSLDELTADLAKIGLQSDVIDLREYDSAETLYQTLKSYDGLWVAGGNSFVIRCEMRRSGLENVIKKLLKLELVYCGESAGAIVAGLTLKGSETADEPGLADQIIWEGLGLTERIIAPHADNPNFIEYINHMKSVYTGNDRVLYLKDDQAFILNS